MKTVIFCLFLVTIVLGRSGFGPTEQEWGYVRVREGANIFWWFHQTSADVEDYTQKPVVIWLQGGPGASSTGYGNFVELGPLDENLNPRNSTWLNYYNLLFVDNPVGTGFSYVDNTVAYATTNGQLSQDFVLFLQGFIDAMPNLKQTPFFIFCESYGGKMTAEIALEVDKAVKRGDLEMNLVGIGLGDAWISPIDTIESWAPYLLTVGAVDQNGYEKIQAYARSTKETYDNGDYSEATSLWTATEGLILALTDGIDFYNILTKVSYGFKIGRRDLKDSLVESIMNTQVKTTLDLNVEWGAQSGEVFAFLKKDFLKPVTEVVESLLNTTNIRVAVYNGQLDLIVDTLGTAKWVDNLKFDGASEWKTADRKSIMVDRTVEGYYKKVGNLGFFWVNRAGHMVPRDNPAAMRYILDDVINGHWKE